MIALKDLVAHLNDRLLVDKIDDFGPNGLQVDRQNQTVHSIATAVSASLETIEQAAMQNVDVLIVHHGIFWNKDTLSLTGTKYKKIKSLLKHDIALLAYHLPLDAHDELGNNWKAARDLKWKGLKPFGPEQKGISLGVQGHFSPLSVEEFQQQLESYYHHVAHVALGGPETVKSAAIISGGAHREAFRAAQEGVDCFITGSFDEPIWHLAKEEKINFFAMGHSNTEEVGPKALGEYLEKKYDLKHTFINLPNPF